MASAPARRSVNPAVRADPDGSAEPGDLLEAEAAGQQFFVFAGQTFELLPFKPLEFQELAEEGRLAAALKYVLGDDGFGELKELCESMDDLREVMELVAKAMGGGSPGESRALRRSSARTARR